MISAPSDVREEIQSIEKVIGDFNRTFGEYNGISLLPVHWSKDVYPQSGGRPQSLINSQIVNESDFVIAVLWTRFGTPTEDFDSGTEEEIEIMLKDNKQVFMYICKRPVELDKVDYKQYEKVKVFKEKYKDRGIYWEYKDVSEFEKLLYNHLTKYFMIKENKEDNIQRSNVLVKVFDGAKLLDSIVLISSSYADSKYIEDLEEDIVKYIEEVNDIILPEDQTESNSENFQIMKEKDLSTPMLNMNPSLKDIALKGGVDNLLGNQKMVIPEEDKKIIEEFISELNLSPISKDFFHLGGCGKKLSFFIDVGSKYEPVGNEKEIEKYRLIENLVYKIHEYNDIKKYLAYIDGFKKMWLVFSNEGRKFDEDITINLYIPKDKIVMKDDIENPPLFALDIFKDSISDLLVPNEKHNIMKYPDYEILDTYIIENPLASFEERLSAKFDEFRQKLDEIFNYKIFEDGNYKILQVNLKYIKQQTCINFPTFLFFNQNIDEIKYDITSKYNQKVEGILKASK